MDEAAAVKEEHLVSTVSEDSEAVCWGCGLNLVLASYSPIFKCGWCGAITDNDKLSRKPDSACFSWWRSVRDRFFVTILIFFMLCLICIGVWAVYPIIFGVSNFYGIFHCTLTAILSIITITSFCLAAFTSAGAPANVQWGSYPIVGRCSLENYTFCSYCSKPKPPRAHHCRSCRMCVLDMDHHCPFIGNCVGTANHRYFIFFLIAIVSSCTYIFLMSLYSGYHVWPSLQFNGSVGFRTLNPMAMVKEILAAIVKSAFFLSARGLVLLYLAFASLSIEIGISVLLWQQLYYIYEGNTYINQINSKSVTHGERGCQNILRFFWCPYPVFRLFLGPGNSVKLQDLSNSKIL